MSKATAEVGPPAEACCRKGLQRNRIIKDVGVKPQATSNATPQHKGAKVLPKEQETPDGEGLFLPESSGVTKGAVELSNVAVGERGSSLLRANTTCMKVRTMDVSKRKVHLDLSQTLDTGNKKKTIFSSSSPKHVGGNLTTKLSETVFNKMGSSANVETAVPKDETFKKNSLGIAAHSSKQPQSMKGSVDDVNASHMVHLYHLYNRNYLQRDAKKNPSTKIKNTAGHMKEQPSVFKLKGKTKKSKKSKKNSGESSDAALKGELSVRSVSQPDIMSRNISDTLHTESSDFLSTDKGHGCASSKRSAHLSLEDALDGLRPLNILYPTRQLLTRPLATPAEKECTATIVFDLDETLCNNRGHGPATLRPGAVEMLKQLRAMYPHPVLWKGETAGQSLGSRKPHHVVGGLSSGNKSEETEMTVPHNDDVMLRLEIIIWTASVEVVARPVIARLDPDGTILDDVIYRDVRWYREGGYTKDLRRIGRYLDRNIIVENAPSSVVLNRRNAILVNDFVNNSMDRQLLIVHAILQQWLDNVNTFLLCRPPAQLKQRRDHTVEEGGESPEPHQPEAVAALRGGSVHKYTKANVGVLPPPTEADIECSLQELELNASAIYFLAHHPFISPATRYVKPSAWRQSVRFLNGGGGSITTTAALQVVNKQSASRVPGGTPAPIQGRSQPYTKPRGHRSFVNMKRGPQEGCHL